MFVMIGAGRLGGRGGAVVAARIPAPLRTHPLILPFRLASVLAAQLFDLGTFTLMVGRHGIISERNPLIAQGFAGFGMPMVALMKLALVVLLASIIIVLDRDQPVRPSLRVLAALITVLAVVGGLVGGISNVMAG
jgi:hypothetical protein